MLSVAPQVIQEFYDRFSGRFIIPIDVASNSVNISESMLRLLDNGHAMNLADDGDGNLTYVIFSIEDDSNGMHEEIINCKEELSIWLAKWGITEFRTVFSDPEYRVQNIAGMLDDVMKRGSLIANEVDHWSIAVTHEEGTGFKIIELHECCW